MVTCSPYAASDRPEIRELIPPNAVRFLDVGCNDGSFGAWLKSSRQCRVLGIEPNESQAAIATRNLDAVVQGFYPESIDSINEQFDCITFNHVLEHIYDPWEALRKTKKLLAPGGRVVSLIPNTRYITLMYQLAVKGRWDYQEAGLLDRTHIRFFTRANAIEMFEESGYRVEQVKATNAVLSRRAPRVSTGLAWCLGEWVHGAYAISATPL